ncbi:MAG: hypothetical protein EPO32_10415 [Anaerolineae bacterium]|nr:MAG: hypothetical protein EPO32_10415 [Anaerolineae bacterium]
MSTRRLVIAITFLSLFAMAARMTMQNDTWYQLASARWMVEHRELLDVDLFSYTRYGQPWDYVQVNWLGQLVMYGFYVLAGPGGLNLMVAGVVTLAYALLFPALSGGAFLRAFAIVLSATAAAVFWPARTNIFSFLFFGLYLWILEEWRWGRRDRLVWLIPAQLVWANTHSVSAAGIALAGVYGLGEFVAWLRRGVPGFGGAWFREGLRGRVGRMLLIGLALVIATCLTPLGPRTLLHPFDTVGVQFQLQIDEWQPVDPRLPVFWPFLTYVGLLLVGVALVRGRVPLVDVLLVGFWGAQAFLSARAIHFFAISALPLFTRLYWPLAQSLATRLNFAPLTAEPESVPPRMARLNLVLAGLVALAALAKLVLVFPAGANFAALRSTSPYEAVDFMRANPPTPQLFNSYNFGGYLVWAYPEMPVFADSRTDLFGDEILGPMVDILTVQPGYAALLDEWGINSVLVEPTWPLVAALKAQGWQVLYEDDVSVLLGR